MARTRLGWMQLKHQKLRFAVALAGIAFAVILIMMQLGFRASLFESAVRYHDRFVYDIAILSNETSFIAAPQPFSSRRLYQALAVPEVESVSPVYLSLAVWKNPANHDIRNIFTVGIDPDDVVLDTPGVHENLDQIRLPDVVIFDRASRPELGPIPQLLGSGKPVFTEANARRIAIAGLFEIGTSFGIDASILTSDTNFLRLFPDRRRTQIDLGLIRLRPGTDLERVHQEIRTLVPSDVLVMTKADFIAREIAYWNSTTPIGYVFTFGVLMGFVVGAIVVYQILFADVSDHIAEYATLKAIGYSNRFVSGVVIEQALILAVLGYLPGLLISTWLYRTAGEATRLPLHVTFERGLVVLLLTIAMCGVSGILALRKVRSADPAEIF